MMDVGMHLGLGQLCCAAAVACSPFVGIHLFKCGVEDLERGLQKSGRRGCALLVNAKQMLSALPVCTLLRIFFAPALWHHGCRLAETGDLRGAAQSLPVVLWLLLFFAPVAALAYNILCNSGMWCLHSPARCCEEWPAAYKVERPTMGLFQTRSFACLAGAVVELLWHGLIIHCGDDSILRVSTISVSVIVWNAAMVVGGPVLLLARGPGPQCQDVWIAQAFILISLLAVQIMIGLTHSQSGIPQVMNADSALGPYGCWSVLAWLAVAAAQEMCLHCCILRGVELKATPPWQCGAADFKEFFLPQFWGLVFYCRGQLVCFSLWILGCYLWAVPSVVIE